MGRAVFPAPSRVLPAPHDEPRCRRPWLREDEHNSGAHSGMTTGEQERLKALEQEDHALRRATESLREASACCAQAELDRRAT